MGERELNAVVTEKIDVSPRMMILRVAPDGWKLPEFEPGQYAVLGLPGSAARCPVSDPEEEPPDPDKLILRTYSMASSSAAREYLEFYIALVRPGALTPRLFNLRIGDRLSLSDTVSGFFTLGGVPPEANIILIATGTGLAPFMSMIRSQLIGGARRHLAIIHGTRHSLDLGYRDELTTLQQTSPGFVYIPVISRPEDEPVPWSGRVGYVQDIWREGALDETWGFHPEPDDSHVFLCGNPGMIESMEEIIKREGFKEHVWNSPGQYHVERFWTP